jgi:hypothetical protein
MAQYKFPYPVKGCAQGQSRGPPIPVVRVDVVPISIVAIRIRPIFDVAITAAAAAAAVQQLRSLSPPAHRTAPGVCLVVSNATVTLTATQSAVDGRLDGNDGSAAIAMQ